MGQIVSAVKAGRLRNGAQRGGGNIIHAVELLGTYIDGQLNPALCGEKFRSRSAIGWIPPYPENAPVTCDHCLAKMGRPGSTGIRVGDL